MRLYRYVGPRDIATRVAGSPPGTIIMSADDMVLWASHHRPTKERSGRITATFVIDSAERLRLADRHTEHLACADGERGLAAGELTLYECAVCGTALPAAWNLDRTADPESCAEIAPTTPEGGQRPGNKQRPGV